MISRIVPNIFALNKEEFNKKLKILEFATEIHLDFMDGKFTENLSVLIEDMKNIKKYPNKKFNIHLMAYNPLEYLAKIQKLNISKIYIQYEAYSSDFKLQYDLKVLKNNDFKIGVVLNPNTNVGVLIPFFKDLDSIMLMSVFPGKEGQKFITKTYSRIKELRNLGYEKEIAIDGGITDNNTQKLIQSGANVLYVGSYITSQDNPKKNYEKLKQLIR